MKKPYLLLVATALLALAGCRSQPTPDDSKKTTDSTSGVTGTEASTSLFCPVFPQALLHHFFLQATVKEAEGEPLEIRVARFPLPTMPLFMRKRQREVMTAFIWTKPTK